MSYWQNVGELVTGVKLDGVVPTMYDGVQTKSRDGRLASWDFEATLRDEWGKRVPVSVAILCDKKPEVADGVFVAFEGLQDRAGKDRLYYRAKAWKVVKP